MEFEQIIKRMDWLDEEHRKDKTTIVLLSERLEGFETNFSIIDKQIKELKKDLSNYPSIFGRVDQFEESVKNYRAELLQRVDEMEKNLTKNRTEVDKRYRLEFDGISKALGNLEKASDTSDLKGKMESRIQEEQRLNRNISELDVKLNKISTSNSEAVVNIARIDENQRQVSKKITDLHTDLASDQKRIEDLRAKTELIPDSIRRIETRLNEVLSSEAERRQSQKSFIEQQALLQVDRDKAQKEFSDRMERMGKQSQLLDVQLQDWDTAKRAVKHAQEVYEEITQKFERRINEITEMQRLSEDRFRQEWVTFKADYQKRWTSQTLSQEEQIRDTNSVIEKLSERLTTLEDLGQVQQDLIQQTKEANEEYLHGMLAQIHELLTAFERISGQPR